ncbi:thiol:disulfide interchange protein DsbA/DsbL [Lonepinella sp. BR2271]|uniref:thiol:disulfide interchange protein DsbA/DsbL n=1 Tax=Lonepinella sp. BR2271 TaxID=3434550 RepID=UPI003F6E2E91
MKYIALLFLLCWNATAWAEENPVPLASHSEDQATEMAVEQADNNAEPFQDGKDYFSYSTPVNVQLEKDRVRIQSFFAYDCRTCVNVQDILTLYKELNADKVNYEEYPIATDDVLYSAQVFYSLHQLKRDDVSDLLLFETTDATRYTELAKWDNLLAWLQQNNIDPQQFDEIFYANPTIKLVNSAIARTEKYGVFTYPFVVLDGKYVLTISTLYNDDYTFAVLDYLVNKLMNNKQNEK